MESTKRIDNHKAKVFKTDHYTQEQVEKLKDSANKQNKIIARWFWHRPFTAIGPTHLHKALFPKTPLEEDWPLSSTKRAVTTLTKADILFMTDETMKSTRGGTEHKWRWKRPADFKVEPKQEDLFGDGQPQPAYAEANR